MENKTTLSQNHNKNYDINKIEQILKNSIIDEKSLETDKEDNHRQPYGNVVPLDKPGLLLDSTGTNILKTIVNEYLSLLETSSAIYEKNGDYALGIFSSGWCKLLDNASREICNTENNIEALKSGKWYCHESCWKVSKNAIETGKPADNECNGGIRIYAVPIIAKGEVVGAINFGYGDPPKDHNKIKEISRLYNIDIEKLHSFGNEYLSRPEYIIDLAKQRLRFVAKLIGVTVENKIAEKKLQETNNQLVQSAKLAAIGKLSASIAHEFNNPICGIHNVLESVANKDFDEEDEEEKRIQLSLAIRECDRVARLVKSLNDFNRPSSGTSIKIVVKDLINDVIVMYKKRLKERDIKLETKYEDSSLKIEAVSDQIKQVFLNIIQNAEESFPENSGGKITISTEHNRANVIIRIEDTGSGIEESNMPHLFEPFFTTKPSVKGTGLGLPICYGIIKMHNGDIKVSSVPGKGSIFTVTLPLLVGGK